jgi:hypothetical protein
LHCKNDPRRSARVRDSRPESEMAMPALLLVRALP